MTDKAMRATDPRERLGAFAHYLREHGFALGYAELELMTRAAAALLGRSMAVRNRTRWETRDQHMTQ